MKLEPAYVALGANMGRPAVQVRSAFEALAMLPETRLMAILVGRRAHLRSIVILALRTGMRRGEILSLRWNEVDFARGLILVKRTKNGRDRMIPMNSGVRETLAAIRQEATTEGQVFRSMT